MNKNCIFCKIVKEEIPSFKIFENERVLAFLDINPLNKGHTLIIPKEHFENIFDISEENLEEIIKKAKEIAEKLKKSLKAESINFFNASGKEAEQSIFHFHLHLIPRYQGDGLEINQWWQTKIKKISLEELKKIQMTISG